MTKLTLHFTREIAIRVERYEPGILNDKPTKMLKLTLELDGKEQDRARLVLPLSEVLELFE